MEAHVYATLQTDVALHNKELESNRDHRNLNADLELAVKIASLGRAGRLKELLDVCKQQGVELHGCTPLLPRLNTPPKSGTAEDIEQERMAGTEVATLLFRELFLPPANHAPHAEALAEALSARYPDLAPGVPDPTHISERPAIDAEEDNIFYAPPNLAFRSSGRYKPLDKQKKEMRLISLQAGKKDQDIQCTLLDPIPLKDRKRHSYVALSYSAGDTTKTAKIVVDDVEFEVYESLERALRRIRDARYAVHVWIDQISINQHDRFEKAWQVSMMREIYSCANRTLVFLDLRCFEGLAANFKKFFLAVYCRAYSKVRDMDLLANMPENTSIVKALEPVSGPGTADSFRTFAPVISQQREITQWLASILLQTKNLPSLVFLIAMYSVPWWRRSWVYQEVIVSTDVVLLCGDEDISWSAFQVFNRLIREAAMFRVHDLGLTGPTGALLKSLAVNQPAVAQIGRARELFTILGERDMRWVLSVWRDLKSTDPRDKIYAALGIAKSRYRIIPDYATSQTITKLLVEVVRRSVLVDRRLDIILDGGEPSRHTEWGLPSWVPNFTIPSRRKFPVYPPQSHFSHLDSNGSQAGPSEHAEFMFKAMGDLQADFEFVSNYIIPPDNMSPLSVSEIPKSLRVKLVRHWSLRDHDLGTIGSHPTVGTIQDVWFRMACMKPKALATAVDDHPGTAPYPFTDDEDLTSAYLQTVHFYPDPEAVVRAMIYLEENVNPMSMNQLQLSQGHDSHRVLVKGYEAQCSKMWRFFCTEDLVMGMVPAGTQEGDWICFAGGTSVPFVLRPYPGPDVHNKRDVSGAGAKHGQYIVVGAAYVHGYMFGRAAEELARGQTAAQWVELF